MIFARIFIEIPIRFPQILSNLTKSLHCIKNTSLIIIYYVNHMQIAKSISLHFQFSNLCTNHQTENQNQIEKVKDHVSEILQWFKQLKCTAYLPLNKYLYYLLDLQAKMRQQSAIAVARVDVITEMLWLSSMKYSINQPKT